MNRLTETKLDRSIRFYNEYVDHVTNEACKKLDVLKKEFTKNKYRDELDAENKEVIAGLMVNLQMAFSRGQAGSNLVFSQRPAAPWASHGQAGSNLAYQQLLAQDLANGARLFNNHYSGQNAFNHSQGDYQNVRY